MSKKPFYITTTLPYVNAEPHLGHAMEFIRADIIARFKQASGCEVSFNTGTDEHGIKIYQKAQQLSLDPQTYVDQAAEKFKAILPLLGMTADITFTRTSDPHHVTAAQAFWKLVDKNGFIYKKNYSVKYCVGCELEKTDSELVNGRCALHPAQDLEIINEENYFFKFSAFQQQLLDLYEKNPTLVVPDFRFNEIKAFVGRGLEDFSISRLATKMPWGIAVPGDDKHVMYVWFDALVNYISTLGWPEDEKNYEKFWGKGTPVQYCGKDNLRQQSAMWQAMLMAAKLSPSHTIIINGFVTGEGGIKMSKSLGNTVDPLDLVKEYGTDALRYYVARELSPFEDSPFTMEKFKEAYNAHLANGIGNLTSRIMKMATMNNVVFDVTVAKEFAASKEMAELHKEHMKGFETFNIQQACNAIWELVAITDKIIHEREPFKKIKTDKAGAEKDIRELLARLDMIGTMLLPVLPTTAARIVDLVQTGKMPEAPLFGRK
jgi:methionyl-tRNA synthetase